MESRSRSVAKALSWRGLAVIITTCVAWIVTDQIVFAATIGVADTVIKLGVYYLHERTWNHIPFGRIKPPEYQI